MFEGDNVYPMFSSSVGGKRLQYDTNGIPLQLFGDYFEVWSMVEFITLLFWDTDYGSGACVSIISVSVFIQSAEDHSNSVTGRVGCNIGSLNCGEGEHNPLMETMKEAVEVGSLSRECKQPISLNNKSFQDNVGHSGYAPNVISTGLRLSYEGDERNSSVTFAGKGVKATLPIVLSLDDNLKVEIDQQKKELDCYMKFQEENTIRGLRGLRLRHMVSFLSAIERGVSRKLYEKEVEIENMNNKNQELLVKIKQVSMELQSWQYRAKYNESVVNALKNNLKQVMAQCVMRGKEAHGDREIEEVASCSNTGYQGVTEHAGDLNSFKRQMNCRACKVKEVCILMLPCRHLCLCKDCEVFIDVCPVCGIMKTARVEVFMS